jgi:hypothetical protein
MSEPDEKEKTRLKNVAQGLTEKIDKLRDGDRDAQREALAKMAVVSETAAYHYAVWAKSSCRNLEATRTYMQIAMGAMKTSTQCHLALSALEVRQIEHETKDESEASAAQQNPETGAGNG